MQQPEHHKAHRLRTKKTISIVLGLALALALSIVGISFWKSGADKGVASDSANPVTRADAFRSAGGTIALAPVPLAERDQAILAMKLPPEQAQALRTDIESGKINIGWIDLWDDQAQDGDIIRVTSGGFAFDVNLHNQPVKLAVPIAPVQITGLHDGGRGITAGLRTSQGQIGTPVMAQGETITIGLR